MSKTKIIDISPKFSIPTFEDELASPNLVDSAEEVGQVIGGLTAGSRELSHGNVTIAGVDEQIRIGEGVTAYDEGVGIFMGKDPDDDLYKFRAGDPEGIMITWDGSALNIVGFLEDGEAAADVNSNVTTIDGGKITANTITATQLITTQAILTTAAQIQDALITSAKIVSLDATKITSQLVNAQIASIEWAKITSVSIETADIENSAITTALIEDAAVTNAKIDSLSASKLTAGTINAATITVTNLNATNITSGNFQVGGTGHPSYFYITRDDSSGSNAYLRWEGGSKMWADTSNRIGINSLGSPMYVYVNSEQVLALKDDGQMVVSNDSDDRGMYVWGNFNVNDGDARISGKLRVSTSSSTSEDFHVGGHSLLEGNVASNHHDPRSGNSYNLGNDDEYWNYIYGDDYVDKSMGWYDVGVTDRETGEIITDMEAIRRLRPHPTQKNNNGSVKIDKKSFPVEIYRPAWDRDNNKPYPRNENDEPYKPEIKDADGNIIQKKKVITDGASLTHTVSLLLGALKEVDLEVQSLKEQLAEVKANGSINEERI